jgi:hypothetical protein
VWATTLRSLVVRAEECDGGGSRCRGCQERARCAPPRSTCGGNTGRGTSVGRSSPTACASSDRNETDEMSPPAEYPLPLFTRVRGRVVPRNPHSGSRIERPLGAPGSPSEGPPTEGQGPHVVVVDRYAAGRIGTAPRTRRPGPRPSYATCISKVAPMYIRSRLSAIWPYPESYDLKGGQYCNRLSPRPSPPSRRTVLNTSTFDPAGGPKRGRFLSRSFNDL